MQTIEERENFHYIRIDDPRLKIYCWKKGEKDISIFNISKDIFEKTAELLGKDIRERKGVRWFYLAKARDGSKVTFYEV